MSCSSCGVVYDDATRFCGECGSKLLPVVEEKASGIPKRVMTAPVGAEVLDLWERFFEDEATKDVTIVAQDDETIKVHSAFLSVVSDAFRAMLSHQMEEGQTRQVKFKDFTKGQLQFIFRLAYTGQVDPEDWAELKARRSPAASEQARVKGKCKYCTSLELASLTFDDSDEEADDPPLQWLFAAATFWKQYTVKGFLEKVVDKLGLRLRYANFEDQFRFAIGQDIAPLRMRCLDFAKNCRDVQQAFRQGSLCPEVMFELQAIWQVPSKPGSSRKRKCF